MTNKEKCSAQMRSLEGLHTCTLEKGHEFHHQEWGKLSIPNASWSNNFGFYRLIKTDIYNHYHFMRVGDIHRITEDSVDKWNTGTKLWITRSDPKSKPLPNPLPYPNYININSYEEWVKRIIQLSVKISEKDIP